MKCQCVWFPRVRQPRFTSRQSHLSKDCVVITFAVKFNGQHDKVMQTTFHTTCYSAPVAYKCTSKSGPFCPVGGSKCPPNPPSYGPVIKFHFLLTATWATSDNVSHRLLAVCTTVVFLESCFIFILHFIV